MRWYIFHVPNIFNQLYSIHEISYLKVIPAVYNNLLNKKKIHIIIIIIAYDIVSTNLNKHLKNKIKYVLY